MAQHTIESSNRMPADSSTSDDADPLQRTCPLCEFATTEENGIYLHLQTSHRKSAISRIVIGHRREG